MQSPAISDLYRRLYIEKSQTPLKYVPPAPYDAAARELPPEAPSNVPLNILKKPARAGGKARDTLKRNTEPITGSKYREQALPFPEETQSQNGSNEPTDTPDPNRVRQH